MGSEAQTLLVDAGNSRIKSVSLANVSHESPRSHADVATFCAYLNTHHYTHVVFSNVGKPEIANAISGFCEKKKIFYKEIVTEKSRFGLTNSYQQVEKMGVDRWLAMIAGLEMTSHPFCVIDVGTAITCDFVADGHHLGGWITPGFEIMRNALVENTAKVTADDKIPQALSLGTNTEDCVSLGCMAAVKGVYLSAVDYLSSKQSQFDVIIGGGGKNMLAFNHSADTICSANLVVHGLARYAKSSLFA
ncbi:type III pantothenate kinase [Alteromonas sp. 14N.309.X.WAT.G.H12]|uniref:type III pantothenate kinase n=1 Tax=Alteromonas sp. 14N.309.X.WAT.G.H12 TaxID=3120824 RepID=UPI002FD0C93E